MSFLSLKVNLNDIERRRFRIPDDFSFGDFITKINLLFQKRLPDDYTLLYCDDDQDWVNFETEDEWREAKRIAKTTDRTLIVKMVTKKEPLPPPSIQSVSLPYSSIPQQQQQQPSSSSSSSPSRATDLSSRANSELVAIQKSVQSVMQDIRHVMRDVHHEASRYSSGIPSRVRQVVRDSGISEYVSDQQIRHMMEDVMQTFSEAATDLSGQVNDAWSHLRRHMSNSSILSELTNTSKQSTLNNNNNNNNENNNDEKENKEETGNQSLDKNLEPDQSENYNENYNENNDNESTFSSDSYSYLIDINVDGNSVSVGEPYHSNPVLNNILTEGLVSSGLTQQQVPNLSNTDSSIAQNVENNTKVKEINNNNNNSNNNNNNNNNNNDEGFDDPDEEWSIITNRLASSEYEAEESENGNEGKNDEVEEEQEETDDDYYEAEENDLLFHKYQEPLKYLNDMGFDDDRVNVELLEQNDGDVPRVVMELVR